MPASRLDRNLLGKIAKKIAKPEKYVREQVSKRASRSGRSSEVAQILWAKELGISTAVVLRNLPPHMQEQVQSALSIPTIGQAILHKAQHKKDAKTHPSRTADTLVMAVDYLLTDQELRSRCSDLLKKRQHQDRVFREATTVLENRIKRLANIKKMNPETLVNQALNPDPTKAILVYSSEPGEQAGFHSLCRGIILLFRNKAHHELDDSVTREDALKFCSFVDVILAMLAKAQVKSSP